jgi:signal transduction histidine kinase
VPSSSSPPARRILVVDDDEGLLILMAEALREEKYEVFTATSAREAQESLAAQTPDLMLLDLKLPDAQGPALVSSLKSVASSVPFVIVTGQGDQKAAVEVMKQGALDYVMKDTGLLDLLGAVVKRALAAVDRERELRAAEAEHQRLEREILEITERERHSIGADLHDNLGQRLTALELMCATLKEDVAAQPDLTRRLDQIGQMLRDAVSQTRSLARGLVPVGSDPDALQNGLTELVDHINRAGRAKIRFECPKPVAVSDPFVAGHLYRIAQEAVNNAVKHAKATEIAVRLSMRDARLQLEISDNGVGLAKSGSKGGIGLGVMRHRASAVGAKFTIESKRDEGVTIRCKL